MKPSLENWTIVVAGAWNAQIFSPEWVGSNLLDAQEFEIHLVFQGSNVFSSFVTQDIIFNPSSTQIICGVKNTSDAVLVRVEDLMVQALKILPYTPINAVGINFGFDDDIPSKELVNLFDFSDNFKLSDLNYLVTESQIIRQIDLGDRTLNLRQTLSSDSSKGAKTHINFHKDVSNAEQAGDWLKGKVLDSKKAAYKIVNDVYGIEIQELSEEYSEAA